MEQNWYEINFGTLTVEEALSTIDDALCYLFEFKVENGKMYYREITQ